MKQFQQIYSVSVDQEDGFGFGGCFTKEEVYSMLKEYINASTEEYDRIIEDGGVDTDEFDISIVPLAQHNAEQNLEDLLTDFNKMTLALAKDGADIKRELTPEQASLLHMGCGVSTEANELLDAIKKHTIYQKPLDVENIKEELGDLLFYMSNLMQSVGLSFEEILQHNIDKLSVRYASGSYSNAQAQQRADKILTGETE
jgi:NTP pyrophosphatase (non-canonical NTP hydrolase)